MDLEPPVARRLEESLDRCLHDVLVLYLETKILGNFKTLNESGLV